VQGEWGLVAQYGLAVFDLDGTLIRRLSACELLARGWGRAERLVAIG
jgi:phosphoserine phosphatase